ncbi:MAG TPA: DUF2480 family protein, partial [Bacteroidetes bacterium]|nr:DUF2480 family protein [Bacteroidota bacterium]
LREKDFRAYLAEVDWSIFADKHVNFYCSADAVIPGWAWLLLGIALEPYARTLVYGRAEDLEKEIWRKVLERIDFTTFEGKKIVVKGCGDIEIPQATFVELIRRLRPVANKLMYGEPCSTVPLYRKSKN